jgi:hypothetical protein
MAGHALLSGDFPLPSRILLGNEPAARKRKVAQLNACPFSRSRKTRLQAATAPEAIALAIRPAPVGAFILVAITNPGRRCALPWAGLGSPSWGYGAAGLVLSDARNKRGRSLCSCLATEDTEGTEKLSDSYPR